MKKSLLALALLSTLSTSFAQITVGDNRNGSIAGDTITNNSTTTNAGGLATVGAITNGGNTMTGGASNSGGNTMTAGNVSTGAVSVNTVDPNSLAVAREMSDIKVRNTPTVVTSNLTSSNDTCMGSVTAGGSGPGLGLAFGTTYIDSNCVMLKNAREMWNMGQQTAAMARLCMDADNRTALELGGYTCPQTLANARKQAAVAANTPVEYNDPIVRHRLGLAPLIK